MVRIRSPRRSHARARSLAAAVALVVVLEPPPSAHAGPQAALMAGYGVSFFDDDFMRFLGTTAHGKEIPIGLIGTLPVIAGLSLGAELRISLMPFTWDYRLSNQTVGEATVSQNAASIVLRYDLLAGSLLPYLRAGFGLYAGSAGLRGDPALYPDEASDFKPSLGINAGAGLQGDIGPDKFWFAELVFHALRRTLDVEGYESWRAHNCGVQAGVGRLF